jgi:hypothetical protein
MRVSTNSCAEPKILDELALYRGGNRSMVVPEALLRLADREESLEKVESDPAFWI